MKASIALTLTCSGFAILAACGGGASAAAPEGTASVAGSINGTAISEGSAVSAQVQDSKGGSALIEISDDAVLCDQLGEGQIGGGQHRLEIVVYTIGANKQSQAPAAPGPYTLNVQDPGGLFAAVAYLTTDPACGQIISQSGKATSGTVTLTSIANGIYAGTFDIKLDTGDRLTGSFSPSACAALQKLDDGVPLRCR